MLPLFIFWIVESFVDKVKSIILLNIYSGFSLQKQSLQNVSNSSQLIQGSLVGPISVLDPNRGLRRAPITYFGLFFYLE